MKSKTMDDENYNAICTDLSSVFDPTVAARFSDGKTLKLDHLSIGNLNSDLFDSQEFLMTVGLRQLMAKRKMNTIFGPKTLRVLEEIGWPTSKNPQSIELQDVDKVKDFIARLSNI